MHFGQIKKFLVQNVSNEDEDFCFLLLLAIKFRSRFFNRKCG